MRFIIKSSMILAIISTLAVATQAQEENSDIETHDNIIKIGEPQKCINSNRLARTKVINTEMVDFTLRNGKIYRNTLLTTCPIIKNNNRFTYRQESSTRLCKGDTISALETISDRLQSFGLCGLGEFQLIKIEKTQ